MTLLHKTNHHKRHLTVTGYVVNKERTKLLLIHHNKLNKWLPAGGHLEPNEIPHEGAIREVHEETGVIAAPVMADDEHELGLYGKIDVQIPRPYAMLYQLIPESKKDIEHVHLDMVFMLEADETAITNAQISEVSDVQWRTKKQIIESDDVFESAKGFARLNLR